MLGNATFTACQPQKKIPHENTKQSAERIVTKYLGQVSKCSIKFDYSATEFFEEETASPSFPGVCTVYRMEIVEGQITKAPPSMPQSCFETSYEWNHKDYADNTRFFKWMEPGQCDADGIRYRSPEGWTFSALVSPPIGLNEDELTSVLKKYKIDTSQFGRGRAKTLRDLSSETRKGEAGIMLDSSGELVRVVDTVLLELRNTDSVLVQTEKTFPDGTIASLNRLPGTKRRPDENYFLSARNIVQRQLKVDAYLVTFDEKDVEEVEEIQESESFPGIKTLYRKKTVHARLCSKTASMNYEPEP